MTNSDYLEKILDLKVKYQAEVKELKESLGADMPLIESQKLTKIACFESFIEELDKIPNQFEPRKKQTPAARMLDQLGSDF